MAFTSSHMSKTPASIHRAQELTKKRDQAGTLLSFTTVYHPPEGFPAGKRSIGLIELQDGTRVTGLLIHDQDTPLKIGMNVIPRMRLTQVNSDGLRTYDIAYEVPVHATVENDFPGYVLALTGPSGVGKTTVSLLLSTKVGDYVERVPIVTTRPPKPGDKDEYVHLSTEEFLALKQQDKLAAFTSIPSSDEKRWYGYRQADINAIWAKQKMPLVITEMNLLQGLLSNLGRRSILSCGLLPPGNSKRQMLSALLHRLRDRGRDSEVQIQDRLKNAEADLQFFKDRQELFDHLIINDEVESVVEALKGHIIKIAKA